MEDYQSIFQKLWQHNESEVVEFKKASNSYDFEKLGKYFSALSNEANLFVALEHSLPAGKDTNSKKRYLGHLLDKLRKEGHLDYKNKFWYITDKNIE